MNQDFESIALGLRPAPPQVALSQNEHLALSHSEASVIARLPNSSEYNVILKIMEGELEKMETECFQRALEKDVFDRMGLMAAAARKFYERFQIEINWHSSEFVGSQLGNQIDAEVENMTPEELVRRAFEID